MQKYVLRKGNDKLLILRKGAIFSEDDFSYTETSNDVTITEYIGSDADVKVLDRFRNFYILGRPEPFIKMNITGYTYTHDNDNIILTNYHGVEQNVDTPNIEE